MWNRQLIAVEGSISEIATYVRKIAAPELPTATALKLRLEMLDVLFNQASSILIKIEGAKGPSVNRVPLMKTYLDIKEEIINWIKKIERSDIEHQGDNRARTSVNFEQTMIGGSNRADHLPRIDLPKFTGSPTEWLAFKGRFEKRVVGLVEDADRYAFLTKCLEGFPPARNTCEALENSGLPFDEALEKLEERFFKKRIAYEGYFFNLLKMKRMNKPQANGILSLIDAVDTMISATQQIAEKESEEHGVVANGLLVCIVKERLDEHTLSKLEEKLDLQKIYSWRDFKHELEKIANQFSCKTAAETAHSVRYVQHNRTVATTTSSDDSHKPLAKGKFCGHCGEQGHWIYSCPAFGKLSVKQRQDVAKGANCCYNCLVRGHAAKNCKSANTCKTCGRKHHTMLHDDYTKVENIKMTRPCNLRHEEVTASSSEQW